MYLCRLNFFELYRFCNRLEELRWNSDISNRSEYGLCLEQLSLGVSPALFSILKSACFLWYWELWNNKLKKVWCDNVLKFYDARWKTVAVAYTQYSNKHTIGSLANEANFNVEQNINSFETNHVNIIFVTASREKEWKETKTLVLFLHSL